ncbi:MAG: pilus assembly protein TadG-related protein [Actinocrinis sp.]
MSDPAPTRVLAQSMPRRIADALRRRGSDQSGVVAIMVALLMTAILASAALAIDMGHFYQAQSQAQSAADAAALAAAQDLGGASSTAASSEGTTIAATNYPGATVSVSEPTPNEAKVVVSADSPSIFGGAVGLSHARVSATAVAGVTSTVSRCTSAGEGCYAIFAMDTSCTNNPILANGGGVTINGGMWSNGSILANGGGMSFGPTYYGSSCQVTKNGGGISFSSGPTPSTPQTTWPVDYSKDFPACAGSSCEGPCDVSTTPCPASNLTPSFCTVASNASNWSLTTNNPATLHSDNIYCAVGTGHANDPSTWNGAILVNGGGNSAQVTFVGGTVTINGGGDTMEACGYSLSAYDVSHCSSAVPVPVTGNYPFAYVTGTSNPVIFNGGGISVTGDVFAPNGSLTWNGGGDTMTGFMESQDVTLNGGGITGDGPTSGSIGGAGGGTVSLLQ